MDAYQHEFIEFAIGCDALRFGTFTLKSGRQSPYFFNTGVFTGGRALERLGSFYARAIAARCPPFDQLFGPAYKGIPLAVATAIAFARHFDRDLPCSFDRKEAKDHGEGGRLLGAPLVGRVLIIDDVISDGASKTATVELIRQHGAEPAGIAIALDRQEKGQGTHSAAQEIEARHGIPVFSIVTLDEVVEFLDEHMPSMPHRAAILEYRERYGTA